MLFPSGAKPETDPMPPAMMQKEPQPHKSGKEPETATNSVLRTTNRQLQKELEMSKERERQLENQVLEMREVLENIIDARRPKPVQTLDPQPLFLAFQPQKRDTNSLELYLNLTGFADKLVAAKDDPNHKLDDHKPYDCKFCNKFIASRNDGALDTDIIEKNLYPDDCHFCKELEDINTPAALERYARKMLEESFKSNLPI